MSNKKEIPNISASEAAKMSVSALAVRPNDASRFGQGGLSAKDLQAWFDKLPNLVKEKFNEIARVLASSEAAKYIGTDALGVDNLYDFLLLFGPRGTGVNDKNISDYIETLYAPLGESTEKSVALKDIVSDIARRLVDASAGHVVDARLESVTNTLVITFADGTDARVDLSPLAADVGVQGEIDRLKETDADFERRLSNIEEHISDDYFVTDDTVAYEKAVPARACTYAKLASFGGMSYTSKNCFSPSMVVGGYVSGSGHFSESSGGEKSFIAKCDPNTTYTLSKLNTSITRVAGFANEPTNKAQGEMLKELANNTTEVTFTTRDNEYIAVFYLNNTNEANTNEAVVSSMMLNPGSTALPYEPFYEGLRDSKVTEIKSHGTNLLPYPYYQKNITSNGITFTDNGDGSITLNGTATENAVLYLSSGVKIGGLIAGETYIPSLSIPSALLGKVILMCNYVDAIEGITKNFTTSAVGAKVYPSTVKTDTIYLLVLPDTILNNVVVYPQIQIGSTTTEYKPYREPISYPIPAEIQALEGYGIGNNSVETNYIDFERKVFKVQVELDENFDPPAVLYHPEPYEVDVSEYLKDFDNIIEVEGGGSLEFVNEYKNAVPSTVKYLLKEESSV